MTVAPGDGCCLRIGDLLLHYIYIDVVITATMHLRKPDFLCHIVTFVWSLLSICYLFGCKGRQKDTNHKEMPPFCL
jgi:hypothetical protein